MVIFPSVPAVVMTVVGQYDNLVYENCPDTRLLSYCTQLFSYWSAQYTQFTLDCKAAGSCLWGTVKYRKTRPSIYLLFMSCPVSPL